jgi:Zn-dependent protease/CBS domain-containing protein
MRETVRLGRIAGIRIGANWSLIVMFGLIVVGLGAAQLPDDSPGHSTFAYYAIAAAVALVFYGCLLAHELAHAIVARRRGIEVEGIVLWLLGGVSKFRSDATEARDEFHISIAGPATSVGLAAGFFVLSRLAAIGHPASLLAAGLGWLGWINALLAVFNLLPAFPLDGGRVLRSALWRYRGDKQRATTAAAHVGEVFGYGFIGLGVFALFFGGYLLDGIWLAAIGWFLAAGAKAESGASMAFSELGGLHVQDVMTRDPLTVPVWVPLDSLVTEGVQIRRLSTFPVVDGNGDFTGLVTLERIRRVPMGSWSSTPASWIALPAADCVTCRPEDDLASVTRRMSVSHERRAVVLSDRRVVGIVTPSDLRRAAAHVPTNRSASAV